VPDYDRDRVYVSDIKKVISWYNLLQEYNLLEPGEEPEDKESASKEEKKEASASEKEKNEESGSEEKKEAATKKKDEKK